MTIEKITASMATIPSRAESLQAAVESLINQVDELIVYLNDWKTVPNFLVNKKIKLFMGENLGDTGKFYGLESVEGFIFTVDDDLVYPKNYAKKMIEKINKYNRLAFICVHGNHLPKESIKSYYRDKRGVHFSKELTEDVKVDVPGTGTLAYHSSLYRSNINDYERKNMTDIWLYKIAKHQNIPIICIARSHQWIKPYPQKLASESIYQSSYKDDSYQTGIVNQIISEHGIEA
jgi:hypothetical protein